MNLKKGLTQIMVIAIVGVQIYPITLAQAIDTETVEIRQSLEGIDGLLQESSQVNLKSDQDSVGIIKTNNSIIDIPKNPDEAVNLKTDNTEINISLPELDNPQEGEIIAKGVVAYASESDFSNTVQANNDGSVRMTTIIDNPNAPTEYEYRVELEQGGKIELQSDGGAIVYNNKQEPISIIAKPWAKDAEGKEVKTWFSTDGLTLIQHVEHNVAGVVYPIVADPVFIPAGVVIFWATRLQVPIYAVVKFCTRHSGAVQECAMHINRAFNTPSYWNWLRQYILRF
ncbi:MAG: hypothetical protein WD512_00065 [Candidatus Paceibacterota bacterium]